MDGSTARYKQVLTSSKHTYNYYSSASPKSKTTILFIHGFPYSSKIWRDQISHFEKLGYGCIAPDILGHGKTSKPKDPAEYSCPVASRSMIDILDAEGVEKAIIVGHDWGSSIASGTAVAYPSRVLALVMVCVPYFKPGPFDLKAINDMTEQAFGAACFGYWEVFLNEPELLTQHIESFYEMFFAKDTAAWVKHLTSRGKLREWLVSDGRCEVKSSIEEIDRQDFLANDWEAALQYYHCFAEGYNEEAEKGTWTSG
ncbi:hypothetical protein ONS95_013464 [Cadophora gregata]|uniref:uncharacterized protein n=1 Tax=Cadophora gregata TaxID=51156 RepID=UPI0026DBD682|nr:uncharacterized protein ONS95_013464 [Cadophora gregata]KAK0099640.1 hypothetical protein ONS96_008139 [Cadophora gregata f. sp. sojae]KAK0116449.1 hypothetical protein ONS95_013464 [Cadophora gregata]